MERAEGLLGGKFLFKMTEQLTKLKLYVAFVKLNLAITEAALHDFTRNIIRPVREKVTNALAVWVAGDCRPINIVEDGVLTEVMRIASGDYSYNQPSGCTIVTCIHSLYDGERAQKNSAPRESCQL